MGVFWKKSPSIEMERHKPYPMKSGGEGIRTPVQPGKESYSVSQV